MSLLPQFGFFELMVVAVLALVVVGPKDLPKLMRTAGGFVAQARRLADEFRAAFDQMAREAEMEELRKEIETLKNDNPIAEAKREIENAVAPVGDALRDEAAEVRDAVMKPIAAPAAPKTETPAASPEEAPAETDAAAEATPPGDAERV
ncbi:MAG: Sec-independent protein translocase protein TatB [Pseudomonadota bacterium]